MESIQFDTGANKFPIGGMEPMEPIHGRGTRSGLRSQLSLSRTVRAAAYSQDVPDRLIVTYNSALLIKIPDSPHDKHPVMKD